ncbi:MAG: phosphoglycerate dehydrogenase [Proteobacteria bacterium]|nr:phosphoglycerate dehydrogenase [Pseudomonadota bacterium]
MNAQSLNVLLYGALVYDLADILKCKLSVPVKLRRLKENAPADEIAAGLREADVVIAIKYRDMPWAPRLALLQIPGAGTDQINMAEIPPRTVICNAYGHDIAAAEYAVLGMLAWSHDFIEAHESFKAGSWRMSGRAGAPIHEELHGKTVGILGLGPIGLKTAQLAKAFGTTVIGCNRTPRAVRFIETVYPLDELKAFLGRCDFLVVSIALTPATTGLIDADAFAAMRPGAVLVNVARGPVIDEDALYQALHTRRIAGAVIDAWYDYPKPDDLTVPPSRFPFHQLPNVIMTPHSSIWTRGMVDRRWSEIAANLDAFANGMPLRNVVRAAAPAGA